MAQRIIIERLEFYGRCGVTEEERRKPQQIAIDLELEAALDAAGLSDRLDETIDYAQVAERLVALGGSLTCRLLESLAEQLIAMLFAEFPVDRIHMWIRKLHAPLAMVAGSVGVRFERTRVARPTPRTGPTPRPVSHTATGTIPHRSGSGCRRRPWPPCPASPVSRPTGRSDRSRRAGARGAGNGRGGAGPLGPHHAGTRFGREARPSSEFGPRML